MKAKPYTPKGKVVKLLLLIESDRWREFGSREAAEIMGCDMRAVSTSLETSRRAGYVFLSKNDRGALRIRGTAYPNQAVHDAARAGTDQAIRYAAFGRSKGRMAGWPTEADDIRIPKVVAGWRPPVMVPVRG